MANALISHGTRVSGSERDIYIILMEERYVLDIGSIWNPDIGIFEILEVYGYPTVKVGALPNVLSPCYLSAAPIP